MRNFLLPALLAAITLVGMLGACERKDNPSAGKGPIEQAGDKLEGAAKELKN